MSDGADQWLELLKGVSRSFYLSLRILPESMRTGAVLAYLLARASDTVADTESLPVEKRMVELQKMRAFIALDGAVDVDHSLFEGSDALVEEQELLRHLPSLWQACQQRPEAELALIKEVLEIIIGGQELDLERFQGAGEERVVALTSKDELEDYTYRVAGCVGEFWTRLGQLTLEQSFSEHDPAELVAWGRDYGMGLQLVNILRDLPEDLAAGRCYLPVPDPQDREALMRQHQRWLDKADGLVSSGIRYTNAMGKTRLRIASGLPAEIAIRTIGKMRGADWAALQERIKIPRTHVYGLVAKGLVRGLFR